MQFNPKCKWFLKRELLGVLISMLLLNAIYISYRFIPMPSSSNRTMGYSSVAMSMSATDDDKLAAFDNDDIEEGESLIKNNSSISNSSTFDKETAVLITSNWIPSAPKIDIIVEVIESLSQLKGLSPRAPVFVIIDHILSTDHKKQKNVIFGKERLETEHTLEEYSMNLMRKYRNKPNVHIINNKINLHIGGNLNKTLHILDDDTKFLYFLQHDFKFAKKINHTAIVKAMKDYPQKLKNVRFNKHKNKKRRRDPCWDEPDAQLQVEGATFTKTTSWSDNNHFASVDFFKSMIEKVHFITRPLESPMQYIMHAQPNCSKWAQHLYGAPYQGRHILHLDGRKGNLVPGKVNEIVTNNVTKAANVITY
jgi:hypothetical protein